MMCSCGRLNDQIFFFKQKTAYEMRISDWSSDVCSSDLAVALPATAASQPKSALTAAATGGVAVEPVRIQAEDYTSDNGGGLKKEIGRASCRERVCQYV